MANLAQALGAMGGNLRPGQSVREALTAQRLNGIQDVLRALVRGENLVMGPGMRRVNVGAQTLLSATARGGVAGSAVEGALRLTLTASPFYDPPDPVPEGTPVFVSWGSVNGVVVTGIDDPIGYVTTDGTRYVWIKAGLSRDITLAVTSAEIVSDPSPTAFSTGAFASDGAPPDHAYVLLGRIVRADGVITLRNEGSGGLVIALHTNGPSRWQLSYWRLGNV